MIPKKLIKVSMKLFNYKRLILLVTVLYTCNGMAQVIQGKKPEPISVLRPATADKVFDIREKLVQLALQNPNYEIADRKVAIAAYQVKKAKGSWLSIVGVQGNINEFSLKGGTTDPVTGIKTPSPGSFYPKYSLQNSFVV